MKTASAQRLSPVPCNLCTPLSSTTSSWPSPRSLGGLVNSIAGGGGFLVFPSLLKAGLLPIEANATGTVALWPGQFTSIWAYREDLRKNHRLVIPVTLVAAIGGLAGALTLLGNSQGSFLRLVPYLFLLGIHQLRRQRTHLPPRPPPHRRARRPSRAAHPRRAHPAAARTPRHLLLHRLFRSRSRPAHHDCARLCGIEKIAEINALKTVITTTANLVAVITFIIGGAVEWRYCWLMMIACAIGGYTGARNARRITDRILRPIIIVLGFAIAIYFFMHRQGL